MGKIKIQQGRPVWVQTPGEQFNEMIRYKFIEMIMDTSEPLTHNDFLFRAWLAGYVRTTKGIISKEVKEKCLQFLKDKRAEQFVESHAGEMEELFEAIGYKNVQ